MRGDTGQNENGGDSRPAIPGGPEVVPVLMQETFTTRTKHTTNTFGTLGPHAREAATKVSRRLGHELVPLTGQVSEDR